MTVEEYEEFLKHFKLEEAGFAAPPTILLDGHGECHLSEGVRLLLISPADGVLEPQELYWPFGENSVTQLRLSRVVIKDLTTIPAACRWLSLDNVEIQSLKGIERLGDVAFLLFDQCGPTFFNCGLLRLMKIGKEGIIGTTRDNMTSTNVRAALEIIKRWWIIGDMPGCQQEMIESGLKQFARL